jgi:hypothetical protein
MNAFEAVIIIVLIGAVVIAAIAYLRFGGPLQELGRTGQTWFDRREDIRVEDRPSEDEMDAPIPKRPIRGRPE